MDISGENIIVCRKCDEDISYTPANTVIYFYKDYPWYSVAQTVCDHCNFKQALFLLENLEWELRWAIANDLGFIEKYGFPSDGVLSAFHNLYEDFPRYHKLDSKENAQVNYIVYLMDSLPPDEWFTAPQ